MNVQKLTHFSMSFFTISFFMMEVFPKCLVILGCLFLLKAKLIGSSVCMGGAC